MAMIWIIVLALVIWGLVIIIGRMLPVTYTAERSEYIEATPSTLWSIIVNHQKEEDWRNNLIQVTKLPNQEGKPLWKEVRRGKKSYTLKTILSDGPQKLVREIVDNKKIGGQYSYVIEPEDEGSRLTIKHIHKIYTSSKRVQHSLFSSSNYAYINQYLSDVKQRALHLREEE
jgi:hypothetical protein